MCCSIEEFPSPPTCGPCKDSLFRECADVTPVPPDIPGLEVFSPFKNNMVIGKKYVHDRNYYNPAKYVPLLHKLQQQQLLLLLLLLLCLLYTSPSPRD